MKLPVCPLTASYLIKGRPFLCNAPLASVRQIRQFQPGPEPLTRTVKDAKTSEPTDGRTRQASQRDFEEGKGGAENDEDELRILPENGKPRKRRLPRGRREEASFRSPSFTRGAFAATAVPGPGRRGPRRPEEETEIDEWVGEARATAAINRPCF